MTYYCTECKKHHADAYRVHWKHRSDDVVSIRPDREIDILNKKVDRIFEKLEAVIDILHTWRLFMDNKHPYKDMYKEAFDIL